MDWAGPVGWLVGAALPLSLSSCGCMGGCDNYSVVPAKARLHVSYMNALSEHGLFLYIAT